jgi:sortase A
MKHSLGIRFVYVFLGVFLGIFCIFMSPVLVKEVQYSFVSQKENTLCEDARAEAEWTLCIPKLNIHTKMNTPNTGLNSIEKYLRDGPAHIQNTPFPGQMGNAVIFGHSDDYPWDTGPYKTIFALLNKLDIGDQVVFLHDQEIFTYKVTNKKIVSPKDLSVLVESETTKTATLITCWPPGTTLKRLAVVAQSD